MPPPSIAVAICTHNRAKDTLECLDALYPQVKDGRGALLVVDSASDGPDKEIIASTVARYPGLRLIRLEKAGLSLARTAALEASDAEWLAYLDDDAIPHHDWFENLSEVVTKVPADTAAIGGRILPLFPGSEPRPLRPLHKMYVSLNDTLGDHDGTEGLELIGANSCYRRAPVLQLGGFATGVGRNGTNLLSGEDVMVMRKLREAGWRIRYNGAFCVGHKIMPERLTSAWVRKRAYWEGITTLRMARLLDDPGYWTMVAKAFVKTPASGLMVFSNQPEQEWDLRFAFNCGLMAEAFWYRPQQVISAWMAPKNVGGVNLADGAQRVSNR